MKISIVRWLPPALSKAFHATTLLALGGMLLFSSCSRQQPPHDNTWSTAFPFPSSIQTRLLELDGRPICIDGYDYYFLEAGGSNWMKRMFLPTVNIQNSIPQTDATSSRFILHDGNSNAGNNVRDGKLNARVACCSLEPTFGIETIFDRRFAFKTAELLGTNKSPTTKIPFPPGTEKYIRPVEGRLGGSVIIGNEIYMAYALACGPVYRSNEWGLITGPNHAGLLHCTVDTPRWSRVGLLDFDATWHDVFATAENLYFIAAPRSGLEKDLKPGLRSVRIPRRNLSQPVTEIVAQHFYSGSCRYTAVAEGNTIHLAWLDTRHERDHPFRSMLTDTPSLEGNLELYYRRRNDSDTGWSEEILLTKGIDFAFDPAIAVEGQNIVVVWSGYVRDENRSVPRMHRSDIFFTTSRDGGRTWRQPHRITDNGNEDLSLLSPQVALHRGTIHLFYIGEGFIYQQRPFPDY